MGVRLRSQYTAHHHLSSRKAFAQQAHQWNGSTLADVPDRSLEVRHAGLIERLLKPWLRGRRIPAARGSFGMERDFRLIGGVVLKQSL